jgi:acetoin:2,6-dichlorophenolindophenol oxidoreductase subunit beta
MQQSERSYTSATLPATEVTMSYAQAINLALAEEMERDDTVVLFGEDVGAYGGVFGVTRGLQSRFGPLRVRDTPISETGFLGCAVGAALCGLRPVVEVMFVDFTLVAMDQIVNQAAKLPYISGGQVRVPLVIRTQQGARAGTAAQHSQCLEAFFAHVPGLRVVAPATPRDARGLLRAAIRSDDPVVFLEHKALYTTSGSVPIAEEIIPIGQANIVRSGNDATVITYAAMLPTVLTAVQTLADEGISVEVIDLRSLAPLDSITIVKSVRRTNRALVVHEAWKRGGFGAELASTIQELAFDYLDAPIRRVGAHDTPKPFSPSLASAYLPDAARVITALRATLE